MPKYTIIIAGATYEIYSRGRAAAVKAAYVQHVNKPVSPQVTFLRYQKGAVIYQVSSQEFGQFDAIVTQQ